jgi:hypothetical protein
MPRGKITRIPPRIIRCVPSSRRPSIQCEFAMLESSRASSRFWKLTSLVVGISHWADARGGTSSRNFLVARSVFIVGCRMGRNQLTDPGVMGAPGLCVGVISFYLLSTAGDVPLRFGSNPAAFPGRTAGIPSGWPLSSLVINRMYRLVNSISSLVVNKRIFFGYVSAGKSLAPGRIPPCSGACEIFVREIPPPGNRIPSIQAKPTRLSPGSWEAYISSGSSTVCNWTPQYGQNFIFRTTPRLRKQFGQRFLLMESTAREMEAINKMPPTTRNTVPPVVFTPPPEIQRKETEINNSRPARYWQYFAYLYRA